MVTGPLDESVRTFLASLLRVLLDKLKWDEEADLGERSVMLMKFILRVVTRLFEGTA